MEDIQNPTQSAAPRSNTGSVRLTPAQMEEAQSMGLTPSQYIAKKIRGEASSAMIEGPAPMVVTRQSAEAFDEVKERKLLEQEFIIKELQRKLDDEKTNGLNGHDLAGLIQKQVDEEMTRRDNARMRQEFDELKARYKELEKELEETEEELEEARKNLEIVEVFKNAAPSIINGFSHKFPKQAESILNGIDNLTNGGVPASKQIDDPAIQEAVQFLQHVKNAFGDNLQEFYQIAARMAENNQFYQTVKEIFNRFNA